MIDKNLILVVDDNSYNLQVLAKILRENSYQIALANNGLEALEFVKRNSPDLILLDIMMPKIDGFKVCRYLKNNPQTKDIPVIFISAITDTEKKLKAFEVGGVDYITKPFHQKEVLMRVKTQLELNQSQKRLKVEAKKQEKMIKQLKETKEKFKQLAENINEIFFIHSSDFSEMIYINPAYEKILQNSCQSLYQNPKQWLNHIHPEDRDKIKSNYQEKINAQAEFEAEYKAITNNGQLKWFRVQAFPVFNQQGEAYRYAGIAEDITKAKQREEELQAQIRLENLITNLSNKFITIERNNIQEDIKQGLAKIAKFIEVDYSYIYLFSENNEEIIDSIKWWKDSFNIGQTVVEKQGVNLSQLPWLITKLKQNEIIEIKDINNLTSEAKKLQEILAKQKVKSSLMIPLIYQNNLLGVLGFDAIKEKKNWDKKELALFQVVADIFSNAIQRKEIEARLDKYYNKLEIKNLELKKLYNNLEAELEKGSKLQQQFLPDFLPAIEGIDYQAFFQPSAKLGGDFYDVIKLEDELLFYLADVSGHGLDGAMLNIFLRETINNYLLYQHNKGQALNLQEIITFINQKYLKEDFPADYFICLLMGVLDTEKMQFRFVNAGFQFPPFYINQQGELSTLATQGLPISSAISEYLSREINNLDYKVTKLSFQVGDGLFMTTDGLLEELAKEQHYGEERLKNVLRKNYQLPNQVIINKIKKDFKAFSGNLTGQDDITFLSFKRELAVLEKFKITINSSMEEIYQAQEKLRQILAKYYPDNLELLIAFQELATNAIEHGNQFEFEQKVFITAKFTKKYFEIIIKDQGSGFNWQKKLEENSKLEDAFTKKERGRGLILAKMAYDELYYNQAGNKAYLFKKLENRGES